MKSEPMQYESVVKQSLSIIRELKEKLETKKTVNSDEPVAVTGMACRFPGGCVTPEAFWTFLEEKGDGVIDIPAERWNADDYYDPESREFGKMYVRQAGFMQEDISAFDAGFFRISPMEAAETDPQQRLLLEVAWEALERAGQNPDRLRGSNTGVFVGIIGSEYAILPRDHLKSNMYSGTGSMTSIASGRIAHILGLHGPVASIDTTCSSSLVSVYSACESLSRRQCDTALAGGVNMMLLPESFSLLCMMGALEKDGRCKPFDADGQGYGRGEGCGMVVLKRLSDAEKDGDPVLAVIRGGAVNHDGASSGLTVPNGNAQRKLITRALKNSDTMPDEMGYLEAHGTGTSLGDPIEIRAVTEVLGTKTRKSPLIIGSVKGNIGHLEGAAGIAGLIKTVLCISHRKIPANINLNRLNPRIRFEKIPAVVPSAVTEWNAESGKPRVAGVSAFGFSGTNAHIILSEAPASKPSHSENRPAGMPCSVMTLSAKSKTALKNMAARYQEHLENNSDLNIGDICYTANACRADFSHRAAFIAKDRGELAERLAAFHEDREDERVFYGKKEEEEQTPKTAFFFTNPSEYDSTSAARLYENLPSFRNEINLCSDLFEPYIRTSVANVVLQKDSDMTTESATVKNACLFSVQHALFRLWESWGASPFAVFGNETGCYAAASAAGVITPETAVRHIAGDAGKISPGEYNAPVCRFLSPRDGTRLKKKAIISLLQQSNIPASQIRYDALEKELGEQGCDFFIKIGGDDPEWEVLLRNLAILYCRGTDIQWHTFEADYHHKKVLLPTYPFERKQYWIAPPDPNGKASENRSDPLEGVRISSPFAKERIEYQYQLSTENLPEIADTHGVIHVGVWSAMLDSAVKHYFRTDKYSVREMDFITASIVSDTEAKDIYLSFTPEEETGKEKGEKGKASGFVFHTKDEHSGQWDVNIRGRLVSDAELSAPHLESFDEVSERCAETYPGEIFYQMMSGRGIVLGKSVTRITDVRRRDGEALARMSFPADFGKTGSSGTGIFPGILDACAQLFHAALPDSVPPDMRYMVVRWEDFAFSGIKNYRELWCHVTIDEGADYSDSVSGAFTLFNENGKIVCFALKNVMKGISDEMIRAMEETTELQEDLDTGLLERLRTASSDEKKRILADFFQETMSDIFGVPPSELDIKEPLRNMGIDSMVGLRFKAAIASRTGIDVPMEDLIEGHSIDKLSANAAKSLHGDIGEKNEKESGPEQTDRNVWFYNRNVIPDAAIRLFCFPYGGGGASLYQNWQKRLSDHIEVCPIQLPGRENRIKETPVDNIGDMTDILEKVLIPETDRPYAIYGHSMGALVAFRLAYRLWEKGAAPAHLFIGGYTSPSIPNTYLEKLTADYQSEGFPTLNRIKDIPPDSPLFKMLTESEEMKKAGAGAEGEPEMLRPFLPMMIADVSVVRSYEHEKEEKPFDVPITVFHGKDDDRVSGEESSAWKELTTGDFKCHVLSGDHFFLHEDQSSDELLNIIHKECQRF